MVFKLTREVSHHNPLILSTNTNHPLKHLSFIYELSWIKHPDFMPNVQKIWEVPCHTNCELTRIQKKLKKSNNSLRGRALINKVNKKEKVKITRTFGPGVPGRRHTYPSTNE